MNLGDLSGRRVLVVGLGVSGFSAAQVLAGLDAKVRVTEAGTDEAIEQRADDLRAEGIEVETGGHDLDALEADLAVLSPGIAPTSDVVTALRRRKIDVIGEIELAWRMARCDVLAVTGTNGKTTTTSLLTDMLVEGGIAAVAAGNIGTPLVEAVLSVPPDGAIAVEVSSFQLATIRSFRPRVGVLLNVAEDHTDWHGSFAAYAAAKGRLTENQTEDDVVVVNADDASAMSVTRPSRARLVPFSATSSPSGGIGILADDIVWRGRRVMSVSDISLPGTAGAEDVLAAAGAALEYGVDEAAVARAAKAFRPLRHRLEVVAEVAGVTYIDDSKATNPHATLSAVRGLREVVLIAGGRSKGIDLTPLRGAIPPVVAVVAIGEAAEELSELFEGIVPVRTADSMQAAVLAAAEVSVPQGSVLLSPGCASLDMYESYAHRGDDFVRCVHALVGER